MKQLTRSKFSKTKNGAVISFGVKMIVAVVVLICALAVACCLGSAHITVEEVFRYVLGLGGLNDRTELIIGRVRLPRVLTAALVGGCLAAVGAVMQGVFKNPMADPSVLGISSGSALGATIVIVSGLNATLSWYGFSGAYVGAIAGALVTWIFVFSVAKRNGEYDTGATLLAGIAISSVMSALITVLMMLNREDMEQVYMWMLGTFSNSTVPKTVTMAIVALVFLPVLLLLSDGIDVLKLGNEAAESLGVRASRTSAAAMCVCSVLLAFCVANSGIIGFVGLIIPHCVGYLRIRKMREKLIMSFLVGAAFMVICDSVAKTIVAPGEMAIGAITSLIGAPYFLVLMMRRTRR